MEGKGRGRAECGTRFLYEFLRGHEKVVKSGEHGCSTYKGNGKHDVSISLRALLHISIEHWTQRQSVIRRASTYVSAFS